MIALLQRVSSASVRVGGACIGAIDAGLLVLVGVQPADDEQAAQRLLERLLAYRVFPDDLGRMNLSLTDTAGGLLLVPQFTLAADTRKGNRPGFSTAAPRSRPSGSFCGSATSRGQRMDGWKPAGSAPTCRWHWSTRAR